MARDCTTITFKRKSKGSKIQPRSQWRTVRRCKGRRLKYRGGKRCRAGGSDWRAQVKANVRRGMSGRRAIAPARFVRCR